MKTASSKKFSVLPGLLLVVVFACIAGIVLFFARMYQRDMQTLTNFIDSYQAYDQAAAAASAAVFTAVEGSTSTAGAEEQRAEVALSNLKTVSSAQVSSLIKNEKDAMRMMREIADFSEQEMSTLKAYRQATGPDANREDLMKTFQNLTEERQAAFAHFRELGR
jgi:myosin heavy subunit